jgi:hypothetical protein
MTHVPEINSLRKRFSRAGHLTIQGDSFHKTEFEKQGKI